MSGISGMGTTFNLPNYNGELFQLSPSETPFLSAIGGIGAGGGMVTSSKFTWETEDLRDPSQAVKLEGATAPTAEARVRATVENVCQIHQEKVSVSYTKQSTIGQIQTPGSAPYQLGVGIGANGNPVTNELDHQVQAMVKQMALDVNYSFINGVFQNPTTNSTPRKTRGLIAAIQTNVVNLGTLSANTLTSATDTITEASTPVANGNYVVFTNTDVATGIIAGRKYIVRDKAAGTFKVTTGSVTNTAITLGTAANLQYYLPSSSALTVDNLNGISQLAYDNGGLSNQDAATILVNSSQKVAITAAYAAAFAKSAPIQGNVGGVNVSVVETDFGRMNIMGDRHVPQDAIIVASLDQCKPVFLNVPGKGVFFEEPLAKTGASDEVQLYGEIGLAYGSEKAHAIIRGAKIVS